jgi:type IV fimbrial biogenesis protein FimT
MATFLSYKTRASRGFTLLELMVTLAIAVILASIAAPSFQNMLASQRVQAAAFDLLANLTLARSEAIKQNRNVTLASINGKDAWEDGWQIYPANEITEVVKAQDAYSGIVIAAAVDTVAVDNVTYNRSGRVASGNPVQFTVKDPVLEDSAQYRCVSVTLTGMPVSRKGGC